MDNKIQIFEDQKIRTAWNAEEEEWYFSVVDVVSVLTESTDGILSVYTVEASDIELTYDFYVMDSYTGEESLEISGNGCRTQNGNHRCRRRYVLEINDDRTFQRHLSIQSRDLTHSGVCSQF